MSVLLVDTQSSSWSAPPGASFPGKGFDGFDHGDVAIHLGLDDIWFWIDYTCVDQDAPMSGIHALPLYVSICHAIVCFETLDYNERAWCRLERAVAYAFMNKGHRPFAIQPGFVNEGGQDATLKKCRIDDPMQGMITDMADMKAVENISAIAQKSRQFTLGAILRQTVHAHHGQRTCCRVLDLIFTSCLLLGLPIFGMEPRRLVLGRSQIVRYQLESGQERRSRHSIVSRVLASGRSVLGFRHWLWNCRAWFCLLFWVCLCHLVPCL